MPSFTSRRRGNTAATVGLSLGVLAGFAALAVDVGMMVTARAQLHNAYDASALGAVGYLDGTADGITAARNFAITNAARHDVFGADVTITAADVVFGRVHTDNSMTFTPTGGDPDTTNAVRIQATNTSTSSAFARIFGVTSLNVSARTTAIKPPTEGAGGVECFLPVSIPKCTFDEIVSSGGQANLTFGGPSIDNAGWANMENNPNTAATYASVTGDCEDRTVDISDTVFLKNGVAAANVNNSGNSLAPVIGTYGVPFTSTELFDAGYTLPAQDPSSSIAPGDYGMVYGGPMAVFDDAGVPCNSVTFTSSKPVVRFVYGVIYDMVAAGNNSTVKVIIDTENEYDFGTKGGGPADSAVRFQPPPALVD